MNVLTLTKEAKNILDKVNDLGIHPNDEDEWTTDEMNFIESISCSNGFWYGLNDGGYIKPEDIFEEAKVRELTKSELSQLEEVWRQISIEF